MPTGYTARLVDKGQTFEEFVWTCARGMGALVMMRDHPMDAPIPKEFKPSDHHLKAFLKAQKELKKLQSFTKDQVKVYGLKRMATRMKELRDGKKRNDLEKMRLELMTNKVRAWVPPTNEHEAFKRFMLQQLETSSVYGDYYEQEFERMKQLNIRAYYDEAVAKAAKDIVYHGAEHKKEMEMTEDRNKWLRQLREGLKPKKTKPI